MDPLIRILKKDCSMPREEIARQIDSTPEEVAERIRRLEEDGHILGYQAIIDEEKAGNGNVVAVIEVKITPERDGGFDRLASRIAKFDQVLSCYLMSGGYDLLVVVEGSDLRDVSTFIAERLSTIEGVVSTATHFRLKIYKENGALLQVEPGQERLPVSP